MICFIKTNQIDIDECQLGEYKCGQEEICVNTFGSYYCKCGNEEDEDELKYCVGKTQATYFNLILRTFNFIY